MREYYAFDGHTLDERRTPLALSALLCNPNLGRVWLVLDRDAPVGYVVLCFGYSLEWLGRDAFIDQFYLREAYRGRGWERKTLAFVEEAATTCNIRTLHLEVVRRNTTALKGVPHVGLPGAREHVALEMDRSGFGQAGKPRRTQQVAPAASAPAFVCVRCPVSKARLLLCFPRSSPGGLQKFGPALAAPQI